SNRRGNPVRIIRSESTLDKKGEEETRRLSTPRRKENSGASRRMVGNPLLPFGRPLARQAGEGSSIGQGESLGRIRHRESLPRLIIAVTNFPRTRISGYATSMPELSRINVERRSAPPLP
ncbi:MAG: hypothetical protein LBF50_09515, partial [Azoarcus sp.]|nr:hypothetical protein [Azoarcus sp.]